MCKSAELGGQRCASSTRAALTAARTAYDSAPTAATDEAVQAAMAEHASTPTGRFELEAEYAAADPVTGLDITHALRRGEQIRERNRLAAAPPAAAVAGPSANPSLLAEPGPDQTPLWRAALDGGLHLHDVYDSPWDALKAEQDARKQGLELERGSAGEPRVMMQARLWDRANRENVALERDGKGVSPRRGTEYGLTHAPVSTELWEAADELGPNGTYSKQDEDDGTGPYGTMGTRVVIDPDTPVLSAQEWVSGTHVERLASTRRHVNSDGQWDRAPGEPGNSVHLYRDRTGQRWVLDGNHNLAAARQAGLPCVAYELGPDDLAEVQSWSEDEDGDWDDEDDD